MHDRVHLRSPNLGVQPIAIQQVALQKACSGVDRRAMTVQEAVERNDPVTALEEPFGDDAADIAGRAGYKYVHGLRRRILRVVIQ